jgi:cytochrome c-type biogenesis protein CcmE
LIRQRAWWVERDAPGIAVLFHGRTRELVDRCALPAALFVLGGAVLAVVLPMRCDAVYSINVGDLLADPQTSRVGRNIRVEGVLVSGSIVKRRARCEYLLLLRSNEGSKLPVRYLPEPSSNSNCVPPDTMCYEGTDLSITVEGRAERTTAGILFTAHTLFAKCPGKYSVPVDSNGRRLTREDCRPIPIVP